MQNNIFQFIAGQLRKPEGEPGEQLAEKMNKGNELMNRWTIELLDAQPYDNILEIGMGNGAFVKDILGLNEAIRYSGIDYSQTMIEQATKLNEQFIKNNRAHFVFGDAAELPFMVHSFNTVFTVNTIYFWEDPSKVFNEIKRVMKTDGKLVIAVRPKSVMSEYPFTKYGFEMYSKEDLSALLVANGFEVANVVEREEPDQEIDHKFVKAASLILVSRKEVK